MLGAEQAGLSAGRHALAWVLGQTDIWYLLYRCAHYVNKRHQVADGGAGCTSATSVLESLFTLDDDNGCDGFQPPAFDDAIETINNGVQVLSLSPPHVISQRENSQVMQPISAPGSPPSSPCITPLSPIGTLDPNWQASKSTVRERNAAMFNNDLMADIKFIVGTPGSTQVIPAHKYVLATGSSVFYAMFYGGLAECKEEIEVPDVEPLAFLTLLKYLYCDEIQLEADTVLATLYVAKKYIVPHLARACVTYLETSLTAKNACLLLSQSRLFEEPDLMQRCWEVIDAQEHFLATPLAVGACLKH